MTTLRETLQIALRAAMKRRDMVTVSVCRSTLGAIDNAEAVPMAGIPAAGAVEASRLGAGAADAAREDLDEDAVRRVVESEIAEREEAAASLGPEHADRAAGLRDGAAVLRSLLP